MSGCGIYRIGGFKGPFRALHRPGSCFLYCFLEPCMSDASHSLRRPGHRGDTGPRNRHERKDFVPESVLLFLSFSCPSAQCSRAGTLSSPSRVPSSSSLTSPRPWSSNAHLPTPPHHLGSGHAWSGGTLWRTGGSTSAACGLNRPLCVPGRYLGSSRAGALCPLMPAASPGCATCTR